MSNKESKSGEARPYNGDAHGELYSPEYALHIRTDQPDHNKHEERKKTTDKHQPMVKEAEAKSNKERDEEINENRSLQSASKL